MVGTEIYLDYQASTPCDPTVVAAMMPYLVHEAANPSSPHRAGRRASRAIDTARQRVAELLGCRDSEVVFTSGATEANNLALLGCAHLAGERSRVITTSVEHKSVLGPCELLTQRGLKLSICPVRSDGQVDLAALAELVRDDTLAVSVQVASNEIGTIQPILEVGQLVHRAGALLHVDAAQAFGKIPVDVDDLEVDLLSISGHKCYGPKGVGALFVRGGAGSGLLAPVAQGGGQEWGLRPGTPNVAAIVGLGEAACLSSERMTAESREASAMRDELERIVLEGVAGTRRNGALGRRLPGATSLTFEAVDAEALIANLPEISLSSSSACNAGAPEPSHVLAAIGLSKEEAYRTIRCAVGRFTTPSEIARAGSMIIDAASRVSVLSGRC